MWVVLGLWLLGFWAWRGAPRALDHWRVHMANSLPFGKGIDESSDPGIRGRLGQCGNPFQPRGDDSPEVGVRGAAVAPCCWMAFCAARRLGCVSGAPLSLLLVV